MKPNKLIAASALALALSGNALALTIDFETVDLSGGYTTVPNGALGGSLALSWDQVWVDDMTTVVNSPGVYLGYENSTGLNDHFAFAAYDSLNNFEPGFVSSFSSTTAFTFTSANLAAAYEPITLTVQGFQTGNATAMFTQTVALNAADTGAGPYLFNFTDINKVLFTVSGVGNPADAEFGMDNLVLTLATPVPEPSERLMLLAGLGLIGWVTRQRMYRVELSA
ncbi:MAG: hypothetical protein ABL892_06205 [Thiobacillaceae bacterium]